MQLGRNLLMDLEDTGSRAQFLIRDRESKFTAAFDTLMTDAGLKVVTTGIRMPRMNSLTERWIQSCRRELLDRTLIWSQNLKGVNIPIRLLSWVFPADGKAAEVAWCGTR
ncbi:hypothetical protein Strvi_6496 [Streptomyces violaceusniger Tu 4113]|uniref:Integrase catalytic domain-containing protein n=1 Tax=Streptomyces violaceusniger (strain Tu 4113) TaxID=653045 RepID=G2NVM9_STRV4|nr:hypothetical protein Strvi_6496 [Streptomyces violaceusniger Tu 4113]